MIDLYKFSKDSENKPLMIGIAGYFNKRYSFRKNHFYQKIGQTYAHLEQNHCYWNGQFLQRSPKRNKN